MAMAATTGTITGYVRGPGGVPIKNAVVTITDVGIKAVTDKNGYYSFTGVAVGQHTLSTEIVTYKTAEQDVNVIQDVTLPLDFTLEKTITDTGVSRAVSSPVRRGTTASQYTITARTEQLTKSQPNNLYQFPGLVFGTPGVTTDPSGYTHLRGSDYNQVGFQVDGISIVEPMFNGFGTNIVTVGLKNANVIASGADASFGGATGGFINEITNNGRDVKGGSIEGTLSADNWKYHGTNIAVGNMFNGGKADYYFNAIMFQNNFPGNTQISKVESFDGLMKFNYYATPKDTFTAFYNRGFEGYTDYQLDGTLGSLKYDENTHKVVDTHQLLKDHSTQSYDFDYLSWKHNFSSTSFITERLSKLYQDLLVHEENDAGQYQRRVTTTITNQIDFTNQFSPKYSITAGYWYIPSTTFFRQIQGFTTTNPDWADPNNPSYGYRDRISTVHPTQQVLYLNNQFKPIPNVVTVDAGVRYATDRFSNLKIADSYSIDSVDPRLGATYSPKRDLVFRTNYGILSEFPDSRRIQTLFAGNDPAFGQTAQDPAAQVSHYAARYTQFNKLKPLHSENFDLGVEKGFQVAGDPYSVVLTGYRRRQYDQIQLLQGSFNPTENPFPFSYNNDGTGHAKGVELELTKRLRKPSDLNGFVSYTYQEATATSSNFDTGYTPYFGTYVSDPSISDADYARLNQQEFAQSYDQRHTVAITANKRISKLIEVTGVLDAGSGYPFAGGATAAATSGNLGLFLGADAQHTEQAVGGADFAEVPVTLVDRGQLQSVNPVVGRSGWHYKISLNTTFHVTPKFSLFLNVDNLFSQKTVTNYATTTQAGQPYYEQPSPEYPQGRVYYGPSTTITPIFTSFGFKYAF